MSSVALPVAKPQEIGIDPKRLQVAYDLLKRWTENDEVPAAGLCVGRRGRIVEPRLFGRHGLDVKDVPVQPDALFIIASITKPVTVTALMMLVERGLLSLEDRVTRFVPKFAQNGKQDVQIRHLMTHTSGLPDQVPNNEKLRTAHRPLSAFVDEICTLPLLFPPGTRVSYQSMGILMLAEVLHQITGKTVQEFLRTEVFEPLGMKDTSLGWQIEKKDRNLPVRMGPDSLKNDWNANSPYWRGIGAPWGGLITSPGEFARFCQMLLNGGQLDGVRILGPATVKAMTRNQLHGMPAVPEVDRRCKPWGLGWRLDWPGHSRNFGDLLGPKTFGHWGATGTVCWIDPDAEAFCLVFTTQPQEPEGKYLARVSNAVAAALV